MNVHPPHVITAVRVLLVLTITPVHAQLASVAEIVKSVNSNKQVICYSCEDMSHLELCDTVEKCGDGELCMVERTHAKYRSRCANISICSAYNPSSIHCVECCNNDYCNGRRCGDEGLVSRHERGPLCYTCNHVRTINECTSIRPCKTYQDVTTTIWQRIVKIHNVHTLYLVADED
ncbi:hypothetical protein DPMN_141762 [Dreissena polymorpha]|uniref:Uncharacterized protein n=1 Tax=Dreissena polymorpha TaxID=45954 RepID=A0A9D4JMW3_DREPO|nr:hypothetical protein DPMN_141762 [Dreissena polymorpha]